MDPMAWMELTPLLVPTIFNLILEPLLMIWSADWYEGGFEALLKKRSSGIRYLDMKTVRGPTLTSKPSSVHEVTIPSTTSPLKGFQMMALYFMVNSAFPELGNMVPLSMAMLLQSTTHSMYPNLPVQVPSTSWRSLVFKYCFMFGPKYEG